MKAKKLLVEVLTVLGSMTMLSGCGRKIDINDVMQKMGRSTEQAGGSESNILQRDPNSAGVESSVQITEIYNTLLEKELIPAYGIATESPIRGTMYDSGTVWMDPTGIVAAYQKDLDQDGIEDLLVFYWTPYNYDYAGNQTYHLKAKAYTVQNGRAMQTDERIVGCDADQVGKESVTLEISQSNCMDMYLGITDVVVNGKDYILFEEHDTYCRFSDGTNTSMYAYELNNGKIYDAFALMQDGWGSAGYTFTKYEFENGNCTNKMLYTANNEEFQIENNVFPKYLNECGIQSDTYNYDNTSVAASNNAQMIAYIKNIGVVQNGEAWEFEYRICDMTRLHTAFGNMVTQSGEIKSDKPASTTENASEATTEAANGEKSVAELMNDPDAYLLPDIATRYLSEDDLKKFDATTIRYARNELYARHGRKFKDSELQNYFNKKNWYYPTVNPDDFNEKVLNEYEEHNRDLIVDYEKKIKE